MTHCQGAERFLRMLKLLMSLNDQRISTLMGEHGFDEETRAESGQTRRVPEADPEAREKQQEAMGTMWAWDKDWAKTARTVVAEKGSASPSREAVSFKSFYEAFFTASITS